MSPVPLALGVASAVAVLTAVAAVTVHRRLRTLAVGAGTAIVGCAGVVAGGSALAGHTYAAEMPGLLPLFGVSLAVDALSGLFLVVTGSVAAVVAMYAVGYTRGGLDGGTTQAMLPLFVLAMLLVPVAATVGTLLLCWELMALTSLVLVLAEHRSREGVATAGRWYAAMTHLGMVAVLIGLLMLVAYATDDSYSALRAAADELPPSVAGAAFVLTLAGFSSKAGIVPLHAWLPRAHPEAPSHVSALMSAAMVNLGVYGIVRVGFDLLGGGTQWWWLLVLTLGAASALYGILQAVMSSDLKRLLGHSTTENMGLVLVAVGAAGMFAAAGETVLAGLAATAAFLHLVNHAAFKTLLFMAAGSVLHATGTRDLDELGGLRSGMPATTWAFGLGAFAASALPPGTAFFGEWLLLQALVHGLPASGTATAVVLPVAVAVVALTAGLSIATFVKAFGVGFLAKPRSNAAANATESPLSMVAAMGVASAVCVALALAPGLMLPGLGAVGSVVLTDAQSGVSGLVRLELDEIAGAVSPLLIATAVLLVGLGLSVLFRFAAARRQPRSARLWDCGAGPLSSRTEYTATSFAEPLQRVFDDVLQPELDVDVTHHRESSYLVEAVEFRRRVPDRIEHRVYEPVLSLIRWWGHSARALATGSVHRYLGYGFYTICGLLVLLVVIR